MHECMHLIGQVALDRRVIPQRDLHDRVAVGHFRQHDVELVVEARVDFQRVALALRHVG